MSDNSTEKLVQIIRRKLDGVYIAEADAVIARLRNADLIVKETIRVVGNLGLWDDPEFAELSKLIDKHEERT